MAQQESKQVDQVANSAPSPSRPNTNLSSTSLPNVPSNTELISMQNIAKLREKQEGNLNQPLSEGTERRIRSITVNKDSIYLSDLKKIAELEGFQVIENNSSDRWLEDHRIALSSGRFFVPTPETYNRDFFSRTDKNESTQSVVATNIEMPNQGRVMQLKLAQEYLSKERNLANHHIGESYLEGGNVLTNTKADGSIGVVIGQDSVDITAKILAAKGKFSKSEVEQEIAKLKESPNQIGVESKVLRDTAVKNLAKRVIARDLAIKPEQLTVIDQPDYHIDVHLRPLNKNTFLIQDYTKSIEVIDSILSDPSLSEELNKNMIDTIRKVPTVVPGKKFDRLVQIDQVYQVSQREVLQQYRELSIAANNNLGPTLEKISSQLAEAGYQVVPVAGSFGISKKHLGLYNPTEDINFLNSVTATGEQGKYYITNEAQTSPLLKQQFEKQLKSELGISNVYFTGGSLAGTEIGSFNAGVDCNTIEQY